MRLDLYIPAVYPQQNLIDTCVDFFTSSSTSGLRDFLHPLNTLVVHSFFWLCQCITFTLST
jgi:hypothetical protein